MISQYVRSISITIFKLKKCAKNEFSKLLITSPKLLDFLVLLYILNAGYPTRRNTDGYEKEVTEKSF